MYKLITEEPLLGIVESARRQIRCGSISSTQYEYTIVNPVTVHTLMMQNPDVKIMRAV